MLIAGRDPRVERGGAGGRVHIETVTRTHSGAISVTGGDGAEAGASGTTTIEFAAEKEEKYNLKKRYKIKFGKDETEIGDFATKEFRPHAKIKRWGEETSLIIELPDGAIAKEEKSVVHDSGKIEDVARIDDSPAD